MTETLVIKPVTEQNRKEAESLEVLPHQAGYVESVRECMKEADALKDWNPVVILEESTLIGFAMYGKIKEAKGARLWFDRFLIDQRYQGKGYGKRAAKVVLSKMKEQYPDTEIYLSVYGENQKAIFLYESLGFQFTGELDTKGEKIMLLQAQ